MILITCMFRLFYGMVHMSGYEMEGEMDVKLKDEFTGDREKNE